MGRNDQGRTLRCRIGMHTWKTCVDADARWQECGRCGRYSRKVVVSSRFPPGGSGDGGAGGMG